MAGGGCGVLLCSVCFQQPAQLASDGAISAEEEDGHTEAGSTYGN